MSKAKDPSKPVPAAEKFKPHNVAKGKDMPGRDEREMLDVARGSENDRRGAARNRV